MAVSDRDVTVYGRLSYAHLFQPHSPNDQAAPKYSTTILIPKSDTETIGRVQTAIQAAVQDGVDRRKFPQPIDPAHTKYPPLRDGDTLTDSGEPRGAEFAGHYFISAKASQSRPPFIVSGNLSKILDENEVYSGCYANVAIQFYAYENSGNKGIAASLVGVQKVADGERLGGESLEAKDVFQAVATPAQQPTGGFTQQPAQPTGTTSLGF